MPVKLNSGLLPGVVLFVVTVLIGLAVYQDYGVSWDEPDQRRMGEVSYNYVFNGSDELKDYLERDHGVGFELPLLILERNLNLSDTRGIYLTRHLATHLFFLLGGLATYILAFRLFKNRFVAITGFLLFVLNPVLYAHSFFNTKDIPFLVTFVFSLLASQLYFSKKGWKWALLLGASCGYMTSIRVMGIILVVFIVVFLLIDLLFAAIKKQEKKPVLLSLVVFLASFALFLYTFFPYLWTNPVNNFIEVFHSMSKFRWDGEVYVNGAIYRSFFLPWFYLPVWIGVSLPILYLVCGCAGFVWICLLFFKKNIRMVLDSQQRTFLFSVLCFVAPLLSIILLHSVVYDGWRHVFFVYAPFVVLALYFINKLYQSRLKLLAYGAVVAQVAAVLYFMISSHPFQNVFFNKLISHKPESVRNHFEMDYWGVSSKQALDYILVHDTSNSIKIFTSAPTRNNWLLLQDRDKPRIQFTKTLEDANYLITNYRNKNDNFDGLQTFYSIKVLNSTILCVYKIR